MMARKTYTWLAMLLLTLACAKSALLTPDTGEKSWECTVNSSDISYSVERCNKTNKLILKVKITEDYRVNLTKTTESTTDASIYDDYYEATTGNPDRSWERFERWKAYPRFGGYYPRTFGESHFHHRFIPPMYPERPRIPLFLDETTIDPDVKNQESVEVSLLTPQELREAHSHFCKEASVDDDVPLKERGVNYHPRYEEVPGVGFYRFHAKPRKWEDARRICEQEGGYLAVLNSEEEARELRKIHERCPVILSSHFNSYTYLGLHDRFNEGKFETVFGEPLEDTGYVRWAANQPDNAHIYGENCLSMNRQGFFNDVPCATELPYFCEHN